MKYKASKSSAENEVEAGSVGGLKKEKNSQEERGRMNGLKECMLALSAF